MLRLVGIASSMHGSGFFRSFRRPGSEDRLYEYELLEHGYIHRLWYTDNVVRGGERVGRRTCECLESKVRRHWKVHGISCIKVV